MAKERVPRKFRLRRIKDLSMNQLVQHYALYKGYIKKMNEIRQDMRGLTKEDFAAANNTYSKVRCIKQAETYAVNGVKLHELYFENLGGADTKPGGKILQLIKRDFGSYERWKDFFKACGKASRGWVIMAYDPFDSHLHLYTGDRHNQGGVWQVIPLLVLDVYEHAYMIDFGINRAKYLDVFMENIDWDVVNKRLALYVYD